MARGPLFVSAKMLAQVQSKVGGSVPVAKIFLPQLPSGLPIRLIAGAGGGNRRVAEARRRPT